MKMSVIDLKTKTPLRFRSVITCYMPWVAVVSRFPFPGEEIKQASEQAGERSSTPGGKKMGRSGQAVKE